MRNLNIYCTLIVGKNKWLQNAINFWWKYDKDGKNYANEWHVTNDYVFFVKILKSLFW